MVRRTLRVSRGPCSEPACSGTGDSDPNDGPAARFAAHRGAGRAARYGIVVNRLFVASSRLFVASRPCLRRAAQRPPAVLSQTTFRSSARPRWLPPSYEPSTAPHHPKPRHNLHLPAPEFNPAPVCEWSKPRRAAKQPQQSRPHLVPSPCTPPHRPPPIQSDRFGPMLMYPAETSGQLRLPQANGPLATCRSKTRVSAISFPLR